MFMFPKMEKTARVLVPLGFMKPKVWPQVVHSLSSLYTDGVSGPGGGIVRYAVAEIRGDWKWQADFGLNSHAHIFKIIFGWTILYFWYLLIPSSNKYNTWAH